MEKTKKMGLQKPGYSWQFWHYVKFLSLRWQKRGSLARI